MCNAGVTRLRFQHNFQLSCAFLHTRKRTSQYHKNNVEQLYTACETSLQRDHSGSQGQGHGHKIVNVDVVWPRNVRSKLENSALNTYMVSSSVKSLVSDRQTDVRTQQKYARIIRFWGVKTDVVEMSYVVKHSILRTTCRAKGARLNTRVTWNMSRGRYCDGMIALEVFKSKLYLFYNAWNLILQLLKVFVSSETMRNIRSNLRR